MLFVCSIELIIIFTKQMILKDVLHSIYNLQTIIVRYNKMFIIVNKLLMYNKLISVIKNVFTIYKYLDYLNSDDA